MNLKNENGVTLTALIITIVILIILAGTVMITTMDNNTINRAEQTTIDSSKNEVENALRNYVAFEEQKILMEGDYSASVSRDDLVGEILEKVEDGSNTYYFITSNALDEFGIKGNMRIWKNSFKYKSNYGCFWR